MCSFIACNTRNKNTQYLFSTITKWKQLIAIHNLNSLSSRRLNSKYDPFHVYIWYTYIMAWKIICTIQYWLLLCFNYHFLLLTKICNHLFDFLDFYQISFVPKFTILCLTKVMNLYMYLFSLIFLYSFIIFAKHGFSVYGERSGSKPYSIVQWRCFLIWILYDLIELCSI